MSKPEPRPVSRAHVLAIAPLLYKVPSQLVKTLMCLAAHADHKTGRVYPGLRVMQDWGIPYSTWHRHCVQLTQLGLIRQVVRGNSILGLAAEYQMLFGPAATSGVPTTTQGEGGERKTKSKSTPAGRPLIRERKPWEPLTEHEQKTWGDVVAALRTKLDPEDVLALNQQIHAFDQLIPLQRTVVRLWQLGHGHELLNELTERFRPDQRTYATAKNVPKALFARLKKVAERHHVHVWDPSLVELNDPALREADREATDAAWAKLCRETGLPLRLGGTDPEADSGDSRASRDE